MHILLFFLIAFFGTLLILILVDYFLYTKKAAKTYVELLKAIKALKRHE